MNTAMQQEVERVRPLIAAAIAKAKELGLRVAPGKWGVNAVLVDNHNRHGGYKYERVESIGCMCPMGCVLDGAEAPAGANRVADAAKVLGLRVAQVEDFIYGFDGEDEDDVCYDEFYALGKEFREEWIKSQNLVVG